MNFLRNPQGEEAPDHLLVQCMAKGDHEAFEMLVRRHQQSVANLAYRFLADASEAEDIAQETFIRFYLAIARYQPDRPLRPYLLKIARNLCLDHLRKKKPVLADNLDTGATNQDPHALLVDAEMSRQVLQAVQSLPVAQRMAVLLQHFEGLSYQKTAEVMATSISAVESLLVRAKKNLREKLKNFI